MKLANERPRAGPKPPNPYVCLLVKIHEAKNVTEQAILEQGLSITASVRGPAQGPLAAEYLQQVARARGVGSPAFGNRVSRTDYSPPHPAGGGGGEYGASDDLDEDPDHSLDADRSPGSRRPFL